MDYVNDREPAWGYSKRNFEVFMNEFVHLVQWREYPTWKLLLIWANDYMTLPYTMRRLEIDSVERSKAWIIAKATPAELHDLVYKKR